MDNDEQNTPATENESTTELNETSVQSENYAKRQPIVIQPPEQLPTTPIASTLTDIDSSTELVSAEPVSTEFSAEAAGPVLEAEQQPLQQPNIEPSPQLSTNPIPESSVQTTPEAQQVSHEPQNELAATPESTAPTQFQPQVLAPQQTTAFASEPLDSSKTNHTTSTNGEIDLFGQKAKKRKLMFASIFAAFFVLLLGGGFVFGYYLPNKPENVWATSLKHTGDEFDAFIEKLNDPATFDTLAKNRIRVTGSIESKDVQGNVIADSVYDEKDSDSKLNVSLKQPSSGQSISIDAQVKAQLIEDSLFPNIFFKVSGLSSLGLDAYVPGISDYENKWISVEKDFYDEYLPQDAAEEKTTAVKNITDQDIASILQSVSDVSKEYLFSTDEEKAVLKMEEFVGTEESEGISANRYKVTIDETHATDYCNALIDAVYANESFLRIKEVKENKKQEEIDNAKKQCKPATKSDTETETLETLDIWMDKKYKLFHKLRVTADLEKESEKQRTKKAECIEKNAKYDYESSGASLCSYYDRMIETGQEYYEVGQIYKNSTELQFFAYGKKDTNLNKQDLRADLSIKLKDLLFDGKVSFVDSTKEDNKSTITLSMSTEAYDGEIDATKPEGSIPLKQVYTEIMNRAQGNSLGVNSDNEALPADAKTPTMIENLLDIFKL